MLRKVRVCCRAASAGRRWCFVATLGFLITVRWDRNFGWDVIPRAAGIGMGIGFLMRAAMYVQQFTASSYLEMRWLHWGNVIFAGVLFGATCVWGD